MAEDSLFISDLHLAPERPGIISLFERFVDEIAVNADTLYILGDFLEYWIGDDDRAAGLDTVFSALARLHTAGTRVLMMHGNRDFLMGPKLARRCRIEIIDDPYALELNGRSALLMHGDLLCTDDIAYQNFRRKVRNKKGQRLFLMLPLFVRERIAQSLRGTSEKATAYKSDDIMDVNQQAVEDAMRNAGATLLIHGHTHRPGVHDFELDGNSVKRIVLGDWYTDGNYLRIRDNDDLELVNFS